MPRSTIVLLLLLGLTPSVRAQARKPGDPLPVVLSGAQAPSPSLKYRLLPDPRELAPGNAATLYYRAHATLFENSALLKDLKERHWYDWTDTPLDDLPKEEVRRKLNDARHILREVELAGRRRDCDWQLDGRDEGIGLILPEVQGFRNIAAVLAVKARLAIAEGRFDDAVAALRTGLTMGQHISQGPTLIHVLVGVACCQVMLKQAEEFVQQPEAPNLYWALTVLPQPFADPRKALLDESDWLERSLPFLKRLEGAPMTLTEVAQAGGAITKMQQDFNLVKPDRVETLARAAYIEAAQKEAKETLIKHGMKAEVVEAMPSFQAVSLFAYREYREAREEVLKWVFVPEGRKHPAFDQAAKREARAADRLDRLFFRGMIRGLGGIGTPAFENVFRASARLDRHIAALRSVEAVRLYAARHGRFPAKLDDVKDVPLPLDPRTGKRFDYRAKDETHAVVATPQPAGETVPPDQTYIYQMELRK
jgi:hypothetical protein